MVQQLFFLDFFPSIFSKQGEFVESSTILSQTHVSAWSHNLKWESGIYS